MTEIYEIHKTLCEGIDNKKKEDIDKVLNTICKVKTEKRKIATFDEALEKSGTKISGMTDKIKEEFTKKWEKGEPIYINDRKLNIPGKE
jgi:DNA-directed RNA polymerase subunit L